MSKPSAWRGILSGVPRSEQPPPPNVVHLPGPSWDDIEREIHEATNQIVHWEAEAHRVEIGFNSAIDRLNIARQRFVEKSKNVDARVDFPRAANHLEREE